MKNRPNTLEEFERFVEQHGYEVVETVMVDFGIDKDKADQFTNACRAEGFDIALNYSQMGTYINENILSRYEASRSARSNTRMATFKHTMMSVSPAAAVMANSMGRSSATYPA